MARILSIDYGKKRSGLAVTDPLQIVPGGLATVATHELFDYLRDYVSREAVELVVIGEPRQANGQPRHISRDVFGNLPQHRLPVNVYR